MEMKKIKMLPAIMLMILAVLFLSGCSSENTSSDNGSDLKVDIDDENMQGEQISEDEIVDNTLDNEFVEENDVEIGELI